MSRVFLSILAIAFLISRSYKLYYALAWTSLFNFEKIQGKKQSTQKLGKYLGEYFLATYLHKVLKFLKAESAMIIFAFP